MLIFISGHVNYPKFSFKFIIYFKGFQKHCFICINIQSFLLSLLATILNLDDLKLSPIETFLPIHNFTHQGQNPSDLILDNTLGFTESFS